MTAGWLNFAQYSLGQAYQMAGRYREAEQMTGSACEQLMRPEASAPIGTTPQYLLLMCCMMKSVTHATLEEIDTADHFQRIAQEIADRDQPTVRSRRSRIQRRQFDAQPGQSAGAGMILDEAFALALEHGVRIFVPITACYRGLAYLEQGRFDEARTILAGARDDAASIGYKSIELRAAIHLAVTLSRLGQLRPALDLLRDARNTARQQGFAGLEAEALARRGHGHAGLQRERADRGHSLLAELHRDRNRERSGAAAGQGGGIAEESAVRRRKRPTAALVHLASVYLM